MKPTILSLLLLALGACLWAGAPDTLAPPGHNSRAISTQRLAMPSRDPALDRLPSDGMKPLLAPTNIMELESVKSARTNSLTLASAYQAGFQDGARAAAVLARRNPDVSPEIIAAMAWQAVGVARGSGR